MCILICIKIYIRVIYDKIKNILYEEEKSYILNIMENVGVLFE
jgi:hypothetical protein